MNSISLADAVANYKQSFGVPKEHLVEVLRRFNDPKYNTGQGPGYWYPGRQVAELHWIAVGEKIQAERNKPDWRGW